MGERATVLAVKVGARARTEKYSPFVCVWGGGVGLNQVLKTAHPMSPSYSSFYTTAGLAPGG